MIFSHFDTILACERQKAGWTDTEPCHSKFHYCYLHTHTHTHTHARYLQMPVYVTRLESILLFPSYCI